MLKVDSEFKALIPPLSKQELKELEKLLLEEGIKSPIVIWNDLIIDGHNRYSIAQKHGLKFKTEKKLFNTRDEVKQWMIKTQLGRRNLTPEKFKYMIGKLYKENKNTHGGDRKSSDQNDHLKNTAEIIADEYKVSTPTVRRAEEFADAIDSIRENCGEDIAEDILNGEIDLTQKEIIKIGNIKDSSEQNKVIESLKEKDGETFRVELAKTDNVIEKIPHVSFNSGDNEWYTPADIIDAARAVMGSIDLDPASNDMANKVVRATKYYTAETNGLNKEWTGNVWLNPPYAGELIGLFCDKLVESNITQAIMLVNNATETNWFNTLIHKASAIVFPKGRVKFYMPDGKTGAPLQGQAIIYFGDNPTKFLLVFKQFGWGACL
jgi:ParB family chromosome partitioning protein